MTTTNLFLNPAIESFGHWNQQWSLIESSRTCSVRTVLCLIFVLGQSRKQRRIKNDSCRLIPCISSGNYTLLSILAAKGLPQWPLGLPAELANKREALQQCSKFQQRPQQDPSNNKLEAAKTLWACIQIDSDTLKIVRYAWKKGVFGEVTWSNCIPDSLAIFCRSETLARVFERSISHLARTAVKPLVLRQKGLIVFNWELACSTAGKTFRSGLIGIFQSPLLYWHKNQAIRPRDMPLVLPLQAQRHC